jgi:DHA3 family macrolide efflux protein-like MFS transporter
MIFSVKRPEENMTENSTIDTTQKWKTRFFTIWTGQAFSMLGSYLVGFAFVWYLTEKTGSATVLTVGTLVQLLPQVLIAPLAGTLSDRWNRKMVMAVFDSITALFTLLVAVLFILDVAQIWHIFLVMFVRSTCGQFQYAAMIASTSLMVPKEHLSRVQGANQTLQGFMNILGPALGAFLIAVLPIQGVLLIDVSTAIIAVGLLAFFKIPQPARNGSSAAQGTKKPSVFKDLAEGWKYVTSWKGLFAIIILAMFVNFLITPAFSLLPLVITEHFNKGAYELGLINSVFGVGVILGGLLLSAWGGFKNRILTSLGALCISGLAALTVGLAPSNMYVMALIGMALFGFLNPIINGPLFAVMQEKVAPELQGRVFSFLGAGASLASPLGLAIAGPISDLTNSQFWFVVGGIMTTLGGVIGFVIPSIANFGKEKIQPSEIEGLSAESNL